MTDWASDVVEANGLSVAYHRTGGEKPALVLLHGYTDNGLCWTATARRFEEDYDVVMPDARGHGGTHIPVEDLRIEKQADDAAAVIRALGLDRPLVWGHSMGGMTALALAANEPSLVRAAVLEDPPLMDREPFKPTDAEQRRFEEDMRVMLTLHEQPLEVLLTNVRRDNPNWPDEEFLPWAQSKVEFDPVIVPQRPVIRMYDWKTAVASLRVPTLLITGDVERGALIPPAIAAEATHLSPYCELAHIGGSGHSIHREQPDETIRRVNAFFTRV